MLLSEPDFIPKAIPQRRFGALNQHGLELGLHRLGVAIVLDVREKELVSGLLMESWMINS